jgi:hypothetical protein
MGSGSNSLDEANTYSSSLFINIGCRLPLEGEYKTFLLDGRNHFRIILGTDVSDRLATRRDLKCQLPLFFKTLYLSVKPVHSFERPSPFMKESFSLLRLVFRKNFVVPHHFIESNGKFGK